MVQPGSNKNINYNATPSTVTSELQASGAEFIVISRTRQSEEPQVWSSGDPQQTQAMFRHVRSLVDTLETTS